MNVIKIAWRSIQHRGLGSLLTIISMALGVMMVVAVLSIHGVVDRSFKSNNSFGYNLIVGARGGGLQLTLNSVYYLSRPVENIPYEYYLAFCDAETRAAELENSIGFQARETISKANRLTQQLGVGVMPLADPLTQALATDAFAAQQDAAMRLHKNGLYHRYTHIAVPLCLGDSYVDPETAQAFRCVGTKPNFFTDLTLDPESNRKFEFKAGRAFVEQHPEHGYFECVLGAAVARRCNLKLGDLIQATHGDPESSSSHLHEQNYAVVGILKTTGTPHDRAVFLNMEGFYLMEDHAKNVADTSLLKEDESDSSDDQDEPQAATVDPFDDDEDSFENALTAKPPSSSLDDNSKDSQVGTEQAVRPSADELAKAAAEVNPNLNRIPLPIEQREVTSVLVRTSLDDEWGRMADILADQIGEGDLERTLDWTPFRPVKSQKAAQSVNPVMEITRLFEGIVNPIRWLLLALTSMICVVSALSIVVGIYNSMNQRQHEIAVMRALGASRGKVMSIMLCEAILLAVAGALLGWVAGHALNVALSPIVEDRTGVQISFFSFAPGPELRDLPAGELLPKQVGKWSISTELLLIPMMMLLAVVVGIYPAISAYRTDVSKALGK